MIWPFRTKREEPVPDVSVDREAAQRARAEAEAELEDARSQRDEVSNIAERLRVLRERNHFADRISEALSGTWDDKRAK